MLFPSHDCLGLIVIFQRLAGVRLSNRERMPEIVRTSLVRRDKGAELLEESKEVREMVQKPFRSRLCFACVTLLLIEIHGD